MWPGSDVTDEDDVCSRAPAEHTFRSSLSKKRAACAWDARARAQLLSGQVPLAHDRLAIKLCHQLKTGGGFSGA